MSHTAGPWRYERGHLPTVRAGDPITGPVIATVHGGDAEADANGRLMALAPQMLTALRGIVADVQSREGWQDEIGTLISWDWWARAVDAVTRAAQDS